MDFIDLWASERERAIDRGFDIMRFVCGIKRPEPPARPSAEIIMFPRVRIKRRIVTGHVNGQYVYQENTL